MARAPELTPSQMRGKYSRSAAGRKPILQDGVPDGPLEPCSLLLAFFDAPVALLLISKLKQSVLGIVPLAALRAFQVAVPVGAAAIVAFGDGESGAATARYEAHSQPVAAGLRRSVTRFPARLQLSSTIAIDFFFR